MHNHKIARKALIEGRIIILAGVILVSMFALVRMAGFPWGGLGSSGQAQAAVVANMISISADTLSSADAGTVSKDFSFPQGFQPTIQVYDKSGGQMYVKVTYDDKGNYYETPILAKVDAVAPFKATSITVAKYITGNVVIREATSGEVQPYLPSGGSPISGSCDQPTNDQLAQYINDAVADPKININRNIDAAFVRAVIGAESGGFQCVDGHLNVNQKSGAAGLMQLLPSTAGNLSKNLKMSLDYRIPADNVKLGTAFLSDLLKQFNGDKDKAVAAYNCGPTRIRCLSDTYDTNWKNNLNVICGQSSKACGSETINYITKVNTCLTACNQKVCGILC